MIPTVSVIIPTYNRCAYVQEAIDSVLAQTYTDYEIFVIDDGSTDGTGEALRARYGDRIRYEWQENAGSSVARNRGIELARGKYIAFLDSDDLWLPEKLAKQVAYLEEHPEIGLVACQALVIDSDGHPLAEGHLQGSGLVPADFTLSSFSTRCSIENTSMVLCRRTTFDAAGRFDPTVRYGDDWDLYIRISARTSITQISEVLSCSRFHSDNQWRLVKRELLIPTLEDNLRVINRGFALLTERGVSDHNRASAEARVYRHCAINALVWGDNHSGVEWLAAARIRDREIVSRLGSDYASRLVEVHRISQSTDVGDLHASMSAALRVLERAGFDRPERQHFLREALATVYFIAARDSNRELVRFVLPRLLVSDSGYARNLGVWSIWFQALVGDRWAERARSFLRRLGVHRRVQRGAS